jgi:ketosteroid isomerase-like protein
VAHGRRFLGLDAVYLGQDGIRKFERDFRGMWESMTMTVEELRDNGDRVAVRATFHAVGRDGLQVSGPISWVTTWSDGLALRVDVTGDWESALEGLA